MTSDTTDPSRDPLYAVERTRQHHRAAVIERCDRLRAALGVTAYRVWYAPRSPDELVELVFSQTPDGRRSQVLHASTEEQLRDEPLVRLTRLCRDEDGAHPRWNGVVRAEWGSTLSTADEDVHVAHALDTAQSWFTTDPMSGEYDDGAWSA